MTPSRQRSTPARFFLDVADGATATGSVRPAFLQDWTVVKVMLTAALVALERFFPP